MDFRRFLKTVWRYKAIVASTAVVGLLAGVAYLLVRPPLVASTALVVLPGSSRFIQTQALIASSNPVLASADRMIHPAVPLATLRERVTVTSLTANVLAISGKGESAVEAQAIANAVAASYLSYVSSPASPVGALTGRILEKAAVATGTVLRDRIVAAVAGLAVGMLTGAIIALGIGRADKRLRRRDEMADAIGVPVLASIPVLRPANPAGWSRLLDGYEPAAVHAWSLRKALRHLGLTDYRGDRASGQSLTVLTLAADRKALALGPQLAAFAASLGVRTTLVIVSRPDTDATATLCSACRTMSAAPSACRANMAVSVADAGDAEDPQGVQGGRSPGSAPQGVPGHWGRGATAVRGVPGGQSPRPAERPPGPAPQGVPGGRPPGPAPQGVPGGRPPGPVPQGVSGGRPPGPAQRAGGLTVVVAAVDGEAPKPTGLPRTTATVLGVSAGAVTAEQLARVALSVVADGQEIAGILIADPDPTDLTTGQFPQPVRAAGYRRPTRMPEIMTDARP